MKQKKIQFEEVQKKIMNLKILSTVQLVMLDILSNGMKLYYRVGYQQDIKKALDFDLSK
jgi:hypothetical protein